MCCLYIKMKRFTITKKIAKHGLQSVIVIPKFLQNALKPRMLVEIKIHVLEEAEHGTENLSK